jgi:hypothetical protein
VLVSEYTLRQTTPEQITTHWSTCYTHHSSCMERKVEEMTQEIQAAEKQAGHFEQLAERMGELNGHMLAEIQALRKAGEALWVELEDAAFGYEGVNWKVQRDAPPVLAAWRAVVEGKEA